MVTFLEYRVYCKYFREYIELGVFAIKGLSKQMAKTEKKRREYGEELT